MGNEPSRTDASHTDKGEEPPSRPPTVIVIEEGTVNSADDSGVDVAPDHFLRNVAARGQASENRKDAEALKLNQITDRALSPVTPQSPTSSPLTPSFAPPPPPGPKDQAPPPSCTVLRDITIHKAPSPAPDGRAPSFGLIVTGRSKECASVSEILPGGAAEREGSLRRGDRILRINGADATRAKFDEILGWIQGTPNGVPLRLDVSRARVEGRPQSVGEAACPAASGAAVAFPTAVTSNPDAISSLDGGKKDDVVSNSKGSCAEILSDQGPKQPFDAQAYEKKEDVISDASSPPSEQCQNRASAAVTPLSTTETRPPPRAGTGLKESGGDGALVPERFIQKTDRTEPMPPFPSNVGGRQGFDKKEDTADDAPASGTSPLPEKDQRQTCAPSSAAGSSNRKEVSSSSDALTSGSAGVTAYEKKSDVINEAPVNSGVGPWSETDQKQANALAPLPTAEMGTTDGGGNGGPVPDRILSSTEHAVPVPFPQSTAVDGRAHGKEGDATSDTQALGGGRLPENDGKSRDLSLPQSTTDGPLSRRRSFEQLEELWQKRQPEPTRPVLKQQEPKAGDDSALAVPQPKDPNHCLVPLNDTATRPGHWYDGGDEDEEEKDESLGDIFAEYDDSGDKPLAAYEEDDVNDNFNYSLSAFEEDDGHDVDDAPWKRWQESCSSFDDSHSGSWDRAMFRNSLDASLKGSRTGGSTGRMLSLGQIEEITEEGEGNMEENTAGGSSGGTRSRSSSADEAGSSSSVDSGEKEGDEEKDNNVDVDAHNVDSNRSSNSLPDTHREHPHDGSKKDDSSEQENDEKTGVDNLDEDDLDAILRTNALMTRGKKSTANPSQPNRAGPAETADSSPRTMLKRQIQAVAQNAADKFIQRGAASRHTIAKMALRSSASLQPVVSTNELESKKDDGKAEEESKEGDAPLPLFKDILSEGCHYLAMSMLVYIYAQLREMSVLGFTEKHFSAIDVNTAERQEKKVKKDRKEWKRGPTKRRSGDDSASAGSGDSCGRGTSFNSTNMGTGAMKPSTSVLSMVSIEEERAPPYNAPTPQTSFLFPNGSSSAGGSSQSTASSVASVEGELSDMDDDEEDTDNGDELLIGKGKIAFVSGQPNTAGPFKPSSAEFERPPSPPKPTPPTLASAKPRYTGNSLSAGAIIRVVLEELEHDEKQRSMSQRRLQKPTGDDELLGFERQHDISILREFRQWVEDSRVTQLDEAAENAIIELRRKVARARWRRSISAVRLSTRLRKIISDPNLKSAAGRGLDETKDGPGTARDEGKTDLSIRRSIAVRRPALSMTKTVKGDWFKLQRRLVEDHFGMNDHPDDVTTEGGGIVDENHTAASKESRRLSSEMVTKDMIDEVIDQSMPSYFKKGSVLSQMMESGIEVVWFGDRHPNEAIYCICINRQQKMVTVVFRGSVNAHNWLHNMKLSMTDHHNPIASEDYHGRTDRFNLHTGFGLYMLRRRKDDGRRKIDEIFRKIHAIGKEIASDGNYRVSVTGHSLGGALSTIFSFYAALEKRFTRVAPVRVFTFAAPRVGDQSFLDAYTQLERTGRLLHARFMNTCDLVPLTPWRSLKGFKVGPAYKHVGMQIRLHKMDFFGKAKMRNALDTSYAGNQGRWFELERVIKNNVVTNITSVGGFKRNHDISELQRRIHFARQYRLVLGHSVFFTDKRRKKLKTLEEYYRFRANIPFESSVDLNATANPLEGKCAKIIIVLSIITAAALSMLWPTPTYHARTNIDSDAHGPPVSSDVESALLTLNHGESPMDMAVHLEGNEVKAPTSFPMEQDSVREGRNTTIEETPSKKSLTSEGATSESASAVEKTNVINLSSRMPPLSSASEEPKILAENTVAPDGNRDGCYDSEMTRSEDDMGHSTHGDTVDADPDISTSRDLDSVDTDRHTFSCDDQDVTDQDEEGVNNLDFDLMDTAAHPTQSWDAFNWASTVVRSRAFRSSKKRIITADGMVFGRSSSHGSVAYVIKSRCLVKEAQRAVKLWEARSFAKEFSAQESREHTLAALKAIALRG